MREIKDITGDVFGRLVALEYVGRNRRNKPLWICKCECGNIHIVDMYCLLAGSCKSCGCLNRGMPSRTKHGMYKHSAYNAWANIRGRVYNKDNPAWKDYGGRGITMCREWEDSFKNFWTDMGDTYREGLSLDRIDTNGNYCKENCRWVEWDIQMHNKRKRGGCSSKHMVFYYYKDFGKYGAQITYNKTRENLGYFLNELDAATAYDNRSEQLYGDRPNGTTKIAKEMLDKSVEV